MIVQGWVRHKESGQLGWVVNSGKRLAMIRWKDPTSHKMLTLTDQVEEVQHE